MNVLPVRAWAWLLLCPLAGCNKPAEVTVVVQPASQAAASAPAAAPIIPPVPPASVPGEAQRQQGAQLAAQGAGGAAPCSTCHGARGEGNPAAGFPRIAGQSYDYLRRQLASYAGDTRNHPVMAPIAKALNPGQQEAVAAYFASLANTPASAAAGAVNVRGQQLASLGDEAKGVQACANCHGPQGVGQGSAYPYLAGQPAPFLAAALAAWRDGTRRNDPSGQMPQIAKSLSDADMQAVAAFYAQMPPPALPRDADLARGAGAPAANAPVVVSGPRGAGAADGQGVGTEQGAPLTGGGQGPGGGGATGADSSGGAPASAASR
jgi:cytochrome c553